MGEKNEDKNSKDTIEINNLRDYQALCSMTAKKFSPEEKIREIEQWGLGLFEVGDICAGINRVFLEKEEDPDLVKGIRGNIGDTAWYLAAVCNFYDWNMDNILAESARKNFDDLEAKSVSSSDNPLERYQTLCAKSLKDLDLSNRELVVSSLTLKLTSEIADVGGCIKQTYERDNDQRDGIRDNVGDAIYQANRLCSFLGWKFKEVLEGNIEKLRKRYSGKGFTLEAARRRGKRTDWNAEDAREIVE